MAKRFDLTVLGGGPGGYVAAMRASQLGLSVALVEKDSLGGTCLNRGCIPTKALLASAERLRACQRAEEFGVHIEGVSADFAAMAARKDGIVAKLRSGVESLLGKRGVTIHRGAGTLKEPGLIEVEGADGAVALESRKVILAVGSRPLVPAAFPYDGQLVVTSDEALSMTELPESVLVVGAGAVGCEFAGLYATLGRKVTLVEMLPQIVPGEDPSAVRALNASFRRLGIDVKAGTKVESIEIRGDEVITLLSDGAEVRTGLVLLAMGRRLSSDTSGIQECGIAVERGAVRVNERMETSADGVYAIGDLVGGWLLAHVASREGLVAAAQAAGRNTVMSYASVPRCTFTDPEIASVGITAQEAQERGDDLRIGRFPFSACGKAVAMGEAGGFAKVFADGAGTVLGGVIVGPHASDLIHEIALALEAGLSYEAVANMIHAHPTLAEATMECAEAVGGLSIHSIS